LGVEVSDTRLIHLLRHAKSSWDDQELDDVDRPLAARGRRESGRLAAWFPREGMAPALVLCSSSLRTRETLAALLSALAGDVSISIERALYAADGQELLDRLRQIPDQVPSVLAIGHNPGLQELALALAKPGAAPSRLQENLPTATLVTLVAPTAHWLDLAEGTCDVVALVVARDLQ
jgi:phosphohistidine phosphatase